MTMTSVTVQNRIGYTTHPRCDAYIRGNGDLIARSIDTRDGRPIQLTHQAGTWRSAEMHDDNGNLIESFFAVVPVERIPNFADHLYDTAVEMARVRR